MGKVGLNFIARICFTMFIVQHYIIHANLEKYNILHRDGGKLLVLDMNIRFFVQNY